MSNTKLPFTGGCACGAIRYECSTKPVRMVQCHCRDCQRASGGPFMAAVVVPAEALKILKGVPKIHSTPSSRGGYVHRGFCAECGSPVTSNSDFFPQLVGVRAVSLDDPSWFRPGYDMWTCDAQPWDFMNPALPKFEQYPTASPAANL